MKRTLSKLARKWPKYILEILVLIIGIYGAFTLDNWNEDRKNRDFEQNILIELKHSLSGDITDLQYNLARHKRALVSQ
jgi:hypothetical protein